MIERSPDLTFIWGFVRSFSSDLRNLILIRFCLYTSLWKQISNKDTFSCIIGGSDCKYKVALHFVLLDYTSLILILWVSWCLHNLSGVMYRGIKAVGSNKGGPLVDTKEKELLSSLESYSGICMYKSSDMSWNME